MDEGERNQLIDSLIDQDVEREAEDVLMPFGLTESDANDAAWDVARVIAPRVLGAYLRGLTGQRRFATWQGTLRELADEIDPA